MSSSGFHGNLSETLSSATKMSDMMSWSGYHGNWFATGALIQQKENDLFVRAGKFIGWDIVGLNMESNLNRK